MKSFLLSLFEVDWVVSMELSELYDVESCVGGIDVSMLSLSLEVGRLSLGLVESCDSECTERS